MFGIKRHNKNNKVATMNSNMIPVNDVQNVTPKNDNFGDNITNRLRSFNIWRDEFMLEASSLLLMVGFIMGTLDVFVRGNLSGTTWFNLTWASVQALSIDGLFFVVWGRVGVTKWTKDFLLRNIAMITVGCVLGLTVMLVNDIVTYQEINSITDSIIALHRLQIDAATFTHGRAILVVVVAILVAFINGRQRVSLLAKIVTALPVPTNIVPIKVTTINVPEPVSTHTTINTPTPATTPIKPVVPLVQISALKTTTPKQAVSVVQTQKAIDIWSILEHEPNAKDTVIALRTGCTKQYVGQQRKLYNKSS